MPGQEVKGRSSGKTEGLWEKKSEGGDLTAVTGVNRQAPDWSGVVDLAP